MNKRERFFAAVRGEKIDRPPVTAWVHFLSDHLTGEQTAALHRCFHETYDWEVAKVMNDYRYPIPAGVQTLEDPASLRAFKPLGLDGPLFRRAVEMPGRAARGTGPRHRADRHWLRSIYQQVLRNVGLSRRNTCGRTRPKRIARWKSWRRIPAGISRR